MKLTLFLFGMIIFLVTAADAAEKKILVQKWQMYVERDGKLVAHGTSFYASRIQAINAAAECETIQHRRCVADEIK